MQATRIPLLSNCGGVAGMTEEIMFGVQMNNVHRFYIPDARFDEIIAQFPDSELTLISARLENLDDEAFFKADYNRAVSQEGL